MNKNEDSEIIKIQKKLLLKFRIMNLDDQKGLVSETQVNGHPAMREIMLHLWHAGL